MTREYIQIAWELDLERSQLLSARTKAGLAAARRRGVQLGRPVVACDPRRVRILRSRGWSYRQIAGALCVSTATVLRRAKVSRASVGAQRA